MADDASCTDGKDQAAVASKTPSGDRDEASRGENVGEFRVLMPMSRT